MLEFNDQDHEKLVAIKNFFENLEKFSSRHCLNWLNRTSRKSLPPISKIKIYNSSSAIGINLLTQKKCHRLTT